MRNVARKIVLATTAFGLTASAAVRAQEAGAGSGPAPEVGVPAAAAAAEVPADAPADSPAESPAPAGQAPAPGAPPAQADPAQPQQPGQGDVNPQLLAAGQAVLAENFAEMARDTIRDLARQQGGLEDPTPLRLAAALLQASTKLSERDPRYWQLLIEAQLQVGDGDGLLDALKGYRAVSPNDRIAQIQLIEYYASRMEAADKELEYLRGLVAKPGLPEEVRSHVGVMVARRLLERDEPGAAVAALDEAIKLNPVDVAALNLKYDLTASGAGPLERANMLLASLRANPVRPALVGEMGRVLAAVGLTREASDWLSRSLKLFERFGGDPQARGLAIDYAAQLYVAGQIQPARTWLSQILTAVPNDIDARLLQAVIDRGAGDQAAQDASRKALADALNAQWAAVANRAAGNADPAATQPAEGAAPPPAPPADPAAVVEQVRASQDEQLRAGFVAAAGDLAWFELYFNEQPGNAGKWVAALEAVLPDDSLTLQRLRGWLQLANNQPDEARRTLTAIQDADPLAALGLLRLGAAGGDAEAQKAGDDRARQLLQNNRGGVLGAMLSQALKDRGLKPDAHPDAAAIRAALQQLPRGWLEMAENPQRFYSVRVDPRGVAHYFSQPVFAVVTVSNLTDQPLTIGDEGIIKPGLWFDADVQAVENTEVKGTAYERLGQTTVLPPRAAFALLVRVDQGGLADVLRRDPVRRFQITGWCTTNVRQAPEGAVVPGPGGTRVPFTRKMTRVGFPWQRPGELQKVFDQIEQGLPDTKIRSLRFLGAYAAWLQQAVLPQADEQQRGKFIADLMNMVERMTRSTEDEVPAVAQWAKFELARAGEPQRRREVVDSLLADTRWEGRLLGLIAANALGREAASEVVGKFLEAAPETEQAFVKAFAAEQLEFLKRMPAATQPAEGAPADGAPAEGTPAPAEAPAAEPAAAPAPAADPDAAPATTEEPAATQGPAPDNK